MPVNVIGTLKPKNNGKFPVAEAVDIKVTDDLRLDKALENKADLSSVNFALAGKADNSDINSLQSQINEIITPVTQDAEVQNARVDSEGISHNTLKDRLDSDSEKVDAIKADLAALTDAERISFINDYDIPLAYSIGDVVDLTPESVSQYRYAIVECKHGDLFVVSCSGGITPRAYGFVDSENRLLEVAGINKTLTNEVLYAPANAAKLIINDLKTNKQCYKNPVGTRLLDLNAKTEEISYITNGLQDQIDEIGAIKTQSTWTWVMRHISTNGNLTTNDNKNIAFENPVYAAAASTISVDTGYKYQYALYDKDTGAFIERQTWKTAPTTLDADYKIRVEISDISESVLTDYSIAEHLHANIYSSYIPTKTKVIENSANIQRIESTVFEFEKEDENALRQSNNIVNAIGIDSFKEKILEVAEPTAYKAWSFVGIAGEKLICLYSVGTSHTDIKSSINYKTSENGVIWSSDREIISTDSQRDNVTGKGYDENGYFIFWVRRGAPGASGTTFELWKATDYKTFEQVSTPTFATANGHIGDIVSVPNVGLFAFWNNYGESRSWGYVKSTDNGETWTEATIETEQTKTSCPVEMSAVYLGNGKILIMGRQDWDGSYGMFQIQSDDYGETFTKYNCNIKHSGSTPSVLYDSESDTISMYCYMRYTGELKLFTTLSETVWDSPSSWTTGTVIATAGTGEDAGNVNACQFGNIQIASFYSGDETNTGIYATIM